MTTAEESDSIDLPDIIPEPVRRHMKIFVPYASRRLTRLHRQKTRMAHYTSAEVALEIIRTRKVWMRQTSCMNDYLEVGHGLDCLSKAYKGDHGRRLKTFIDNRFPGLSSEVEQNFDGWQAHLRDKTFVACLSEHAGPGLEKEDEHGRLSMWRGYARSKGVALILKQDPFWITNAALGLFTTPVAYLDDVDYAEQLGVLATSLEANADYLDTIGREWLKTSLISVFSSAAVSTKHPGFIEEREWRVVRTPNSPLPCPLEIVTKSVNGVPQDIMLLDLRNDAEKQIAGLELPALLDRIIIGPSEYSLPMYYAFQKALETAGIDPANKVKISGLPLRASSM